MDGFTQIEERNDSNDRWRIMDAIAVATTHEEVAEIQATCEHRYKRMSHECWICGHVQTVEEIEADSIPF
jgi:acetone carboxylase gamma subunit